MRREGTPVWVLTVRSFVRKRHRVQIVDGDVWTFDTPFFWWQHLRGTVSGHERFGPCRPDDEALGLLAGPRRRHGRPSGGCRVYALEVVVLVG
jgi:hypothetical protein